MSSLPWTRKILESCTRVESSDLSSLNPVCKQTNNGGRAQTPPNSSERAWVEMATKIKQTFRCKGRVASSKSTEPCLAGTDTKSSCHCTSSSEHFRRSFPLQLANERSSKSHKAWQLTMKGVQFAVTFPFYLAPFSWRYSWPVSLSVRTS